MELKDALSFLWAALALPLGWLWSRITKLDERSKDHITEEKVRKLLKEQEAVLKAEMAEVRHDMGDMTRSVQDARDKMDQRIDHFILHRGGK